MRLMQAAYYLLHTGLQVDEIGNVVGYSNLSYFHEGFTRHAQAEIDAGCLRKTFYIFDYFLSY